MKENSKNLESNKYSLYNLLFHPSKLFTQGIFKKSKLWIYFFIFPFFGLNILITHIFIKTKIWECSISYVKKTYLEPISFFTGQELLLIYKILGMFISGLFSWYIIGWWFNLKLKWSAITNYNNYENRLVNISNIFVANLLFYLFLYIIEIFISNKNFYLKFHLQLYGLIFFIIYNSIIDYIAVRSKYGVNNFKILFWFLILPSIFFTTYLILMLYYLSIVNINCHLL